MCGTSCLSAGPDGYPAAFIKPFTGLAGPGGFIVGNAEVEEFTATYARDLITDEQRDIWTD